MKEYFFKRGKNKFKIITKNPNFSGLKIKPKLKERKNMIKVIEITIIDNNLKSIWIHTQFDIIYRRLFKMILDIMESSDATGSDCQIALNEIKKVESMIENKYQKNLKNTEIKKMNQKLFILKEQMERKLMEIYQFKMYNKMTQEKELTEEKGRGR